ncbi:ADP-ribosylglycohydrolase family protein [Actinokineospora sp. NPDC004072]
MSDIVYEEVPVVDSEWDGSALPGVPAPDRAVLRWEQVPLDARWLPNGPARPNPDYVDGYRWIGGAPPTSRLDLLAGYLYRRWISRETFLRHVLDCPVYLPAEIPARMTAVPVAGSLEKVPALYPKVVRTQLKVWRRTADPRLSASVKVGVPLFNVAISAAELFDTPELDTPEIEQAELVLPELEPGVACADLSRAGSAAREGGRGFSTAEARSYGAAARIWQDNLERRRAGQPESWPEDLRAAGLVERYDADGALRPRPWNFGKFGAEAPYSAFSAFALSGAYVGFALGEAVGLLAESGQHPDGAPLRWGPLTRHLLAQSVAVIRAFADEDRAVPPSLPVGEPSWLTAVLGAELPPLAGPAALLTTALPAAAACGGRVGDTTSFGIDVASALWGPDADQQTRSSIGTLVRVLHKMLDREFRWPTCVPLRELARDGLYASAQALLDLRDDRGADDEDQLDGLGDGRSPGSVLARALLAAAKRDYDPTTALLLAVSHRGDLPLTAAITGALLGARHGTAGLPAAWVAALDRLGVVENVAEDTFANFALHGIWRESQSDRENWRKRYWPDAPPVER